MSDVEVSNETVWPTVNDIAQTADDGKLWKEAKHTAALAAIHGQNYVLSGLTVPASSANLDLAVALGTAMLSGYHVMVPGATTITLPASSTSYIFLKLHKDGGSNVDKIQLEHNTTGTPPADSVLLATAVTSGSAVTSTQDRRPQLDTRRVVDPLSHHRFFDDFNGVTPAPALATVFKSDELWYAVGSQFALTTGIGGILRVEADSAGLLVNCDDAGAIRKLWNANRLPIFRSRHAWVGAFTFVWGLMDAVPTNGANPANGLYLRNAGAANFYFVARSGGTESTVDSGVAAVSGAYHEFVMEFTAAASIKCYIDGVLAGTLTTNIPTADLGLAASVASGSVGQGMNIDYVEVIQNRFPLGNGG